MVAERFEAFVDPVDGTRWSIDMGFLGSRWTCLWGNGCQGILEESTEELGHGCCSVGTELLDDEEAMLLSALAATLDDDHMDVVTQSVQPLIDAGVLDGVAPDHRIDAWTALVPSPGHSPGHVCVAIDTDTGSALITGDAFHSPLQFTYPAVSAES